MVSSDAIVVWLENVRKDDIHIVGGKCANLGELTAKGVTVPPGFAVTADAFRRFLGRRKTEEVIKKTFTSLIVPGDRKHYKKACRETGKTIRSAPIPPNTPTRVEAEIPD